MHILSWSGLSEVGGWRVHGPVDASDVGARTEGFVFTRMGASAAADEIFETSTACPE